MSTIEWIFITELVLLATAGMFWLISLTMARESPNDPFVVYFRTFWRILLRRRIAVAAAISALDAEKVRQYEQFKETGDVEGIKGLLGEVSDNQDFADREIAALIEQARKDDPQQSPEDEGAPPPAMSATVNIRVIPFSPRDELVSFDASGAVIKVTTGPEEGTANKAVIEMLCALLSVKSYQITLVRGHYRADKLLQIAGIDQATVLAKASAFT
jgi:uncharacterized protein YggU (UPF0235/DUF167 family)